MTRKVTENMLQALRDGREWKEKATSTHRGERGMLVRLHDNLIAVVTADSVELTAQGWPTATTCDRLNAIARAFAGANVGRRKGSIVLRMNGNETLWGATDWIKLARKV